MLGDPAKFGQFHVALVGLVRMAYDLYLEKFPNKNGIPPMLIELEKILQDLPTAPQDGGEASQGQGAPIPQFAITSHMAEEGFSQKTSSLVVGIFRKTFTAATVDEKLQLMEDFAKKFNEGAFTGVSPEEQLKGTIILDFFRRLVQDYDASSAGFLFESFLALLLDGTKMGGNQRLEDFIIGSSTGSSFIPTPVTLKLYQAGTSETTSAFATYERFFEQNPGGAITSISGIKMEGDIGVTLYRHKITQNGFNFLKAQTKPMKQARSKPHETYGADVIGLRFIVPKSGAPKVGVSISASEKIGDIYFGFLSVEEDQFFDQAQAAFTGAAQKIGEMFEFYNNFKFSSTEYLSGLDPNKGSDAVLDFLNMKKAATEVFKDVEAGGEKITEQKITEKMIQKLIQEKFKK